MDRWTETHIQRTTKKERKGRKKIEKKRNRRGKEIKSESFFILRVWTPKNLLSSRN